MTNKILNKCNTKIEVGNLKSVHLKSLIQILTIDLGIPFIGIENLTAKLINSNLNSKGKFSFISSYSGFDANRIDFSSKLIAGTQYIKIDVEPNSYFSNGNYDEMHNRAYLEIKKLNLD